MSIRPAGQPCQRRTGMPTPGQRTASESVRAVLGGQPLLSPCSIVYTTPCRGSVGSSRLTDTFFPPPHCPTLQQVECLARGRCCASSPPQPLPHRCVDGSLHVLGQLFSNPFRVQANWE
jgi:hypothetical protein